MLKYLKKYWLFAILAPLFMVGEVLADLVQPRLMSTIVDEGVLGLSNNGVGNLNLVLTEGLKMIIFVILGGLSGILCGVCANIASQNFGNDLRKDIFKILYRFTYHKSYQRYNTVTEFYPDEYAWFYKDIYAFCRRHNMHVIP